MSVAVSIQESTVPAPARVDWTMKACLLLVPHTHTHTHAYKLLDEGVLPAGPVHRHPGAGDPERHRHDEGRPLGALRRRLQTLGGAFERRLDRRAVLVMEQLAANA